MNDPFVAARDGDLEYVQAAISDGFSVNKTRWSGFTLLHRAAENGHTGICEYLVQQGANVNLKTTWGWHTPVHLALGNGWKETAAYLVEAGANGYSRNKDKQTPSEYANIRGFRDLSRDFAQIIEAIKEAKRAAQDHQRMKRMAELNKAKQEKMAAMMNKLSPNTKPRDVVPVDKTIQSIQEN